MRENTPLGLNRRSFLLATAVSALSAPSWGNSCYAPYTSPDASLPLGPFDGSSTASDVVAKLDLTGKTAVVTGCNSGLGYETMRALTSRGATVIGTARNQEKAEKGDTVMATSTRLFQGRVVEDQAEAVAFCSISIQGPT